MIMVEEGVIEDVVGGVDEGGVEVGGAIDVFGLEVRVWDTWRIGMGCIAFLRSC